MKKNAKNQGQVLAALALAFILGAIMVPGAAFAEEVETSDEGIMTLSEGSDVSGGANAEGDGAGEATTTPVSEDVAENTVELYNRIYQQGTFADYRAAVPLVTAVINARSLTVDAQAWAEGLNISSEMGKSEAAWDGLSAATKAAVAQKPLYEALTTLEKDALATENAIFGSVVNQLNILASAAKVNLGEQINKLMPEVTDTGDMDLGELLETAEGLKDYQKFEDLYTAVVSVAGVNGVNGGANLTAAGLKAEASEGELMIRYNALALAAVAIDGDVMQGLMSYALPKTGAPEVETPNTGVNDGIVEGSLDLAMVTLIASAVVATLAGTGVLARLYLHRKF